MRNYDVTLIFSPLVQEQAANDILSQLASFVQEKGGILGDQHFKGKRPLLAPIDKHQEGFLASFSFTLTPEHLEEFEKYCKEQKDILRFLVAKHIKHTQKARLAIGRPQPVSAAAPAATEQVPAAAAALAKTKPAEKSARNAGSEEKIDLQDIDKKLEEIFKEQ